MESTGSPEPTDLWARERRQIDVLTARALRRTIVSAEHRDGRHATIDGGSLLTFTSNDYLGLAQDSRLIEAAVEATRGQGTSVAASRLLLGSTRAHDQLEDRLAALKGHQRALLFSTGYLANLGVITALSEPGDVVFSDALNHASIIDGCRLARSRAVVYRHADMAHLEQLLRANPAGRRIIVSETVFSMDGDIACVPQLVDLADRYGAILVLDEAHATGVLGDDGGGALSHFGIREAPVVIVGTLSKALGSMGGFVAADEVVIATLLNRARSFIFTTALPPSAIAAANAALDIVEEEPWRRKHVQSLAERMREGIRERGYSSGVSATPIVPLILGEAQAAVAVEQQLRAAGIMAKAIRPPTVAPGSSRIRFNLSASHLETDVERVLQALPSAG